MRQHLVVIGGGQAAIQTIQTARQLGYDGRITLVAEETELPYQRPPLSKQYLAGEMPRDRLQLRPHAFFATREVELLLGNRASGLDTTRRRIVLEGGATIDFTSLLLATGGSPRRLGVAGEGLRGIHYLRTLADVDSIKPGFLPGRRLVVVGGGYIGLEVAAVAIGRGLDVTVLEAADRVLARVVAPGMSAFYADYHRTKGVRIVCGAGVRSFRGSGEVRAVETDTGQSYPADLVIVGIGIAPRAELAIEAGFGTAGGIPVDAHAQTAAPGIAAAGDCTRQVHPQVGRELRIESVHNAVSQGKAAAHTLAGSPSPFSELPWFWSDQYELKLQIAGIAVAYDETVLRGDPADGQFSLYYLRGGIPIAVDCVNNPREFMLARKLLGSRPRISPEVLADPDADLGVYANERPASAR